MAAARAFEDLFDLRPVAEAHRRAGGLNDKLAGEIAGHLLLVVEQQALEVADAAELAAELFAKDLPVSNAVTIVSGLAGVFSGFAKPVIRAAKQMDVDPRDVFFELGKRKVVGGQEDLILEVANELARLKKISRLPK